LFDFEDKGLASPVHTFSSRTTCWPVGGFVDIHASPEKVSIVAPTDFFWWQLQNLECKVTHMAVPKTGKPVENIIYLKDGKF
jgi:hypothetical protein